MDMAVIVASLQAKVDGPIEHYGFFMTKGSFTKAPAGAIGDAMKMLGGFRRKKRGGDLTGVSSSASTMGLDNHQTALVMAGGLLYAVDTTTSMGGTMSIGEGLGIWPIDELVVEGTRKSQGKSQGNVTLLLDLDITHPPSGGGGQMQTMTFEGLDDPTLDLYEAITALN